MIEKLKVFLPKPQGSPAIPPLAGKSLLAIQQSKSSRKSQASLGSRLKGWWAWTDEFTPSLPRGTVDLPDALHRDALTNRSSHAWLFIFICRSRRLASARVAYSSE